jgi:hypothetical protein
MFANRLYHALARERQRERRRASSLFKDQWRSAEMINSRSGAERLNRGLPMGGGHHA